MAKLVIFSLVSMIFLHSAQSYPLEKSHLYVIKMDIKNKLITAMVFTAEETGGLIIHLNGFEDQTHANKFLKRLMKNSGIDYKSIHELFDLPTIH